MLNDDIVAEVRAIREAHASRFNCDLRAIYEDLKQSEAARIASGHPYIAPPATPPGPHVVTQRVRFARR
jgi:hypothetical protein